MDISFGPEADTFRIKYRTWLQENLPAGWGTDTWLEPITEEGRTKFWLDFEKKMYEAGYACPGWPKEYGGGGMSLLEQTVWVEENALAGIPDAINIMATSMIGPTLLLYGTEEQKKRFIPKMVTDEEIWCQGYSEPEAGCDLASLKTKAVLKGDEWIITGQKTWATQAFNSGWCFLLARTDPDLPRHKGLTCLLVDLNQPGVIKRGIEQITGYSEFGEIFFDEARTPKDYVVGAVNNGWRVGQALLGFERGGYALGKACMIKRLISRLKKYAAQVSRGVYKRAIDDPFIFSRFVQLEMELEGLRLTIYRNLSQYIQGQQPGAEGSIVKVIWTELWQQVTELGLEIMGPLSDLYLGDKGAVFGGEFSYHFLECRGWSIASGSNEIQRNIIAERILGLPK